MNTLSRGARLTEAVFKHIDVAVRPIFTIRGLTIALILLYAPARYILPAVLLVTTESTALSAEASNVASRVPSALSIATLFFITHPINVNVPPTTILPSESILMVFTQLFITGRNVVSRSPVVVTRAIFLTKVPFTHVNTHPNTILPDPSIAIAFT